MTDNMLPSDTFFGLVKMGSWEPDTRINAAWYVSNVKRRESFLCLCYMRQVIVIDDR
jgi:hypothetical protein